MSEEIATTESDNVAEKGVVSDTATDNATISSENGEVDNEEQDNSKDTNAKTAADADTETKANSDDDADAETETETSKPIENDEQPTDLFDALKSNDAVDGEEQQTNVSAEEPMEVDEHDNDADEETVQETSTNAAQDEQIQNQNDQNDQNDGSDEKNAENNENAESAEQTTEEKADESSQMEVDCETPEGEDVPDLAKKAVQADDSIMEHNVEQLNCSNFSDPAPKDQPISDDPFDSLLRSNDTVSNIDVSTTSSTDAQDQRDNEAATAADEDDSDNNNDNDDDLEHENDNENEDDRDNENENENENENTNEDDRDTSSHHDGSTIEGKRFEPITIFFLLFIVFLKNKCSHFACP